MGPVSNGSCAEIGPNRPSVYTHRVALGGGTTFYHINTFPRLAGTTHNVGKKETPKI